MFYLNTGLPGASKTLNTITTLVQRNDGKRRIYYNNIRLVMLDWEVVNSFSGWFYGFYLVHLKDRGMRKKLDKIITRVHEGERFVSAEDVPFLSAQYDNHNNIETLLYWYRRLYSKKQLESLEQSLSCFPDGYELTFDVIEPFNLHFVHFENPREWHELPKRSIVLIDEAQQFFPQRPAGSKVPPAIAALETHRHHGYDLYWITQDAMLLDVNARRLVGRHTNYFNALGGKRLTRISGSKVFNPDDYFQTKALDKKIIKHNKAFYGSYFSAEIHTHKFKVPKFAYVFVFLVLLLSFSFYGVYSTLFSSKAEQVVEQSSSQQIESAKTQSVNALFSEYLKDVHINGSLMRSIAQGFQSYDYAFVNTSNDKVFHPENVGLLVVGLNDCLAKVYQGDFVSYVTCEPYTASREVEEEQKDSIKLF